jgi:hypothetical protein
VGLRIEVLELKNKCLLRKWLFKILIEEGVSQELLRNKYLHSKSLGRGDHETHWFAILEGSNEGKREFLKGVHSQSAMARILDFGKILG